MERKKLGFMNISREDVLTRSEMRSVLAGSGSGGCVVIPCQNQYMCCCNDGFKACLSPS